MFTNIAVTLLETVGKVASATQAGAQARSSSLSQYTRMTRVEPIVLLDRNVTHLLYLNDILQTLTAQIAAYYMQAVAVTQTINNVDTIKLLEKLNPDRGGYNFKEAGRDFGMEDYQYKLPRLSDTGLPGFGMEAITETRTQRSGTDDQGNPVDTDVTETKTTRTYGESKNVQFGKDPSMTLQPAASLATGILLNVTLGGKDNSVTIPVTVRLAPSIMPPDALLHILSYAERNTSVKERWWGVKSGELHFVKDFILCQDLIDAHKATLMKDKSGVYAAILERRKNNTIRSITSGNVSVATASNIVVMTKDTARQLEGKIGGKLTDPRVRERIFDSTYMMILVIIDTEFEIVTVYTRGLALPMQVTTKAMKNASRGNGPDVGEILKAYQLGTTPTL